MKRIVILSVTLFAFILLAYGQDTLFVAYDRGASIKYPYPREFLDTCQDITKYNLKTVTLATNYALAPSNGYFKDDFEKLKTFQGHLCIILYPMFDYIDGELTDSSVYMYAPDYHGAFSGDYYSNRYYLIDFDNLKHLNALQKVFKNTKSDELPISDPNKWAWIKSVADFKVIVVTKTGGKQRVIFSRKKPEYLHLEFDDKYLE